jgi:hypothetical protein
VLRFELPADAAVSLTVFDLQGRVVSSPLHQVFTKAGVHEARLTTAGWKPGCYFAALDADGTKQTRRLVVVR